MEAAGALTGGRGALTTHLHFAARPRPAPECRLARVQRGLHAARSRRVATSGPAPRYGVLGLALRPGVPGPAPGSGVPETSRTHTRPSVFPGPRPTCVIKHFSLGRLKSRNRRSITLLCLILSDRIRAPRKPEGLQHTPQAERRHRHF